VARIRSLKPETPADKGLASHPIEVRYTFLMVVARADDYGLLLAETRQLVGELYPHDANISEGKILSWVEVLVQGGFLRWRLTKDGARVLEVVNWEKHQNVKNPGQPILRDRLLPPDHVKIKSLPKELVGLPEELVPRKGEGEGKGERKVSASGGNGKAGGWPDQAQRIYAEHIGHLAVGRLGKALSEVVKAHGWDTIEPWFTAYCKARPYQLRDGGFYGDRPGDKPDGATRDTRFCSPEDFARTLNTWRDRCAPLVQR
jgi:hypothetical protein